MKVFYENQILDGQTLQIRAVEVAKDLNQIWQWWTAPHTDGRWSVDFRLASIAGDRRPFNQSDLETYLRTLQGGHEMVPAILRIGHHDIGYTEGYRIGSSTLANHPMLDANDRGFHLLIGNLEFVGRGVGTSVMEHIIKWQFQEHPEAKRVGGEPKYDNLAAIKSLLKLPGSRREADIQLPHKMAAVVIIERDAFFGRR